MTEEEWLTSTHPVPMLAWFEKGSRKRRLLAAACCARITHLLTRAGRRAVVAAEEFADGEIDREQLHRCWQAVGFPGNQARQCASAAARAAASCSIGYDGTAQAVASALGAVGYAQPPHNWNQVTGDAEALVQAALLRDIFGNPFRPVAFEPRWRTADVLGLARGIYDERAFDRLPLLADALMDAGCADEQVLAHCRSDGVHVRGCWIVDLVLGKE
jgi:hypothetical protein